MNEPHDMPDPLFLGMVDAALAGIRTKRGAGRWTMPVVVCLNDWSTRRSFKPGAANYVLWSKVDDPNPKGPLEIGYHCYFDPGSAGQSAVIEAGWLNDVKEFTAWCATQGVRANVGEFAFATDGGSVGTQFLEHIETHPEVYTGWNWWGAGGLWGYQYLFRLDPYASRWDPLNPDAAKAAIWAKPLIDRPQMATLTRYFGR